MDPVIFFAARPDFDNLCYIDVCNGNSEILCESSKPFQAHISKCRELIFTEQDIIASPAYDQCNVFHIILSRDLFKSGRIQNRLHNQGLIHSKPNRVGPVLYQTCLRYTVQAKLAPTWNKVGDWYIHGKDFLTHTGHAQVIRMNLCVNKNEIYVTLCGSIARSPPLQIEDLDLSETEKLALMNLADNEAPNSSVDLQLFKCHVLPSMKQGWISALSLIPPSQTPFTSYKDLCRYWKNMYGYRLPRTDEHIIYCQVSFWLSGNGNQFTYPNVCLRVNPTKIMERVDPKPVLKEFLQDLHSRVNTVCGMMVRFAPRILYPIPSLVSSGMAGEKDCLSNRSLNKSTIPYRSKQSVALICARHDDQRQGHLAITEVKNQMIEKPSISQQGNISNTLQSGGNNQSVKTASFKQISNGGNQLHVASTPDRTLIDIARPSNIFERDGKSNDHTMGNVTSDNSVPCGSEQKLVPLFRPKQAVKKPSSESIGTKNTSNRFTPVFKPISKSQASFGAAHFKDPIQDKEPHLKKNIVPMFRPNVKPKSSIHSSHLASKSPSFKTNVLPVFQPQPKVHSASMKKSDLSCKKRKSGVEGESTKKSKPEIKQINDADMENMARQNQLVKVNVASMIAWLKEKGIPCKTKDKKTDLVNKVCRFLNIPAKEE